MKRCGERGSITLVVVAVAGLLMFLGAALGVSTAMVRVHRSAQSAADLAALAAAQTLAVGGDACAEALDIAAANGSRLTECAVAGREVTVAVVAPGPHWLGQTSDLEGRARAGPG